MRFGATSSIDRRRQIIERGLASRDAARILLSDESFDSTRKDKTSPGDPPATRPLSPNEEIRRPLHGGSGGGFAAPVRFPAGARHRAAERAESAIAKALELLELSLFSLSKVRVAVASAFLRELIIPFGNSGYVALLTSHRRIKWFVRSFAEVRQAQAAMRLNDDSCITAESCAAATSSPRPRPLPRCRPAAQSRAAAAAGHADRAPTMSSATACANPISPRRPKPVAYGGHRWRRHRRTVGGVAAGGSGLRRFRAAGNGSRAGGNSTRRPNAVSAHPLGVRYWPLPRAKRAPRASCWPSSAAQGRPGGRAPGLRRKDSLRRPQERLYIDGYWQEGVCSTPGRPKAERAQYSLPGLHRRTAPAPRWPAARFRPAAGAVVARSATAGAGPPRLSRGR